MSMNPNQAMQRPGSPGGTTQGPAVQMVNTMISEAVRLGASDIHIEPRRQMLEVRFRIDGILQTWKELAKDLQDVCVSRVKVMAELDINEKRLPQDGRITITLPGKSLDMRISTLPVLYGEKVVMRLLDRSMSVRPLSALDFSPHNKIAFEELIHQPLGLILVTGPTGSGKTTTLYSALNVLRSKTTNIVTCEDPVEYDMEGINQSAVFEKVGLTFARQLRAIMRQDPDIILVGEIRDSETAEIAFRAGMTGHLVLSTLHANDAPTSITRLLDMGVPPFLVSSGLTGMVAQRLLRRLDPAYRRQGPPTAQQAALLSISEQEMIWHPGGGPQHENGGYKGRIGVHEVVVCDERMSRMIMSRAPSSDLRLAAQEAGMITMREDALMKLRAGLTSVEEIVRQVYIRIDEYAQNEETATPPIPMGMPTLAALPAPA